MVTCVNYRWSLVNSYPQSQMNGVCNQCFVKEHAVTHVLIWPGNCLQGDFPEFFNIFMVSYNSKFWRLSLKGYLTCLWSPQLGCRSLKTHCLRLLETCFLSSCCLKMFDKESDSYTLKINKFSVKKILGE